MKEKRKILAFTDLQAWQEAHRLAIAVYAATKKFPKDEMFGLISQMRRAAVSVTSNIAEGFGRHSLNERVHFFYLAQGSLTELKNQLILSKDVGYLTDATFLDLIQDADISERLLHGLLKGTKKLQSHK